MSGTVGALGLGFGSGGGSGDSFAPTIESITDNQDASATITIADGDSSNSVYVTENPGGTDWTLVGTVSANGSLTFDIERGRYWAVVVPDDGTSSVPFDFRVTELVSVGSGGGSGDWPWEFEWGSDSGDEDLVISSVCIPAADVFVPGGQVGQVDCDDC